MTVEPITVWAAFGTFVLGMVVGIVMVLSEAKRARRRWREANRKWHEIEAVAVELRSEHNKLGQHEVPNTGRAGIRFSDFGKLFRKEPQKSS